jgi:transcriptional regulator with XRE-family HTH domain
LTNDSGGDHDTSPVDEHVGARLKRRRAELRLSQGELANLMALSFRQVQKYEKGTNRMGASRLYDAARVLGVSVDYFFTGMSSETEDAAAPRIATESPSSADGRPQFQNDVIELIRAYRAITDPRIRRRVQDLAKVLADKPEV